MDSFKMNWQDDNVNRKFYPNQPTSKLTKDWIALFIFRKILHIHYLVNLKIYGEFLDHNDVYDEEWVLDKLFLLTTEQSELQVLYSLLQSTAHHMWTPVYTIHCIMNTTLA